MQTAEVAIAPNIRVILKTDSKALDEVVVVAYGTQSARTVTASVSTVRADALKDVPSVSFDQMLQGRASGVSITTPSAGVGQAPIVRVRGVNSITSGTSPLYVVDGVPIESGNLSYLANANALADINPADIVSMDVLKDAAAAALYGSRAANGVILITTKQGQSGKVKVSYDGFVGFSNATDFYEMMNAQEYVDFKNLAVKNRYGTDELSLTTGYVSPYGNKAFNMMKDANGNYVDTDWKDAAFQNGLSQSHSVAVSGGSDKVRYYLSGNYTTQEGIVKGDKYDRLGVKANINVQATDWLKVGMNTNVTTGTTSYVDAARRGSNFAVGGFPRLALINAPNLPMYNEDGTPYYLAQGLGYGGNTVFSTFSNPAAILSLGNGLSSDVTRFIGVFYAEATPLKGLSLKTQYGVDYARIEEQRFWSPLHGDGVNSKGLANAYNTKNNRWTWTNTATYNFSLGQNNFNLLAGTEASERNNSRWTAQRKDLQDDKFVVFQGPFGSATAGGSLSNNTMVSYFGRINYDYASKYIVSLNYRRDGYSALSEKNRWGNFGGVSAAWRVSEEGFFKPLRNVVDDLKIKGSYGVVGNTDIYDYASKSFYSSYNYGINGTYGLAQIADPNLKWESSEKYSIGFNARLLDRISVDFDYYYTKSSDLILDVPQSPSKGIPGNIITTNAGKMKNSGIELTVSADVIRNSQFTWETSFNITTNKNKVISLADGVENILKGDNGGLEITNITVPGKSIGRLYLYPTAGVDPKSGRRVFITPEGDRTLLMFEKGGWFYEDGTEYAGEFEPVDCGNTLPTWYGGWTNNFKYKGFDLSLFFQFSGGNKIYNGTKASVSDMRYWNNSKDVYKKYWTPERTHAEYPMPIYGDNYSNGSALPISDLVERGDYLRLKNVSLGYTFNTKNWSKAVGISALRLYVQAQNLFVITGYSGMDPETLTNVESATLSGGTDKNTLPQARTYTIGVNLTF
ncbi:tonB-linked outer membrane, SusC/RagA family protein [Bacteroides fragilis str. S38L5]|jgi:TonB-linked SusC/RagA family outer membrane protein|uniref:SusC/RagA family TonB-linked outer membrane protein n=13 Tax=Bacteroides fragilis TaxID=817 RepID=A0A0E2ATT9_BACFG|nr:TonB-dependent receptor [Bacteroides fragilis]EES88067.2 SusC/RagA family TonB-linked outer membrane protein [Bacteroides sp. 3_2_5]EIK38721.1 SusC/RagA family TonB-linked outer membrane protein [Bacteroides fragilis CL07T00C01]EIY99377.1 SusC/RagA family TonB-linked outer membrane protein [Bacteroides fragilis CL07T12C05]EXZ02028.1 tonB-linked outer membrane, SusC/RagA family protein [Bacteroides fragilis str. DS-166]EXZ50511.1 tonB-linked outer membrane, SusC/RagA family protein [Bacteroi